MQMKELCQLLTDCWLLMLEGVLLLEESFDDYGKKLLRPGCSIRIREALSSSLHQMNLRLVRSFECLPTVF